MRAAYYERKGPAREVLQVGELPDPEPGPGEVRVRVQLSSVNPSDVKVRSGWDGDVSMPFPRVIPHQDGMGVVDRVGPGVPAARVGQPVWLFEAQRGRAHGTACELVAIAAGNAVPVPEGVDPETAACLGVPAMTAHRCLFADGAIHGQTVLVAGGGGAVGNAAVQLATWAGARVVTTVSRPEQEAVARAAGAALVLDRRAGDLARRIADFTRGEGVDRVIEVAFEQNLALDRQVLRPNGVISTYASGADPRATPAIPYRRLQTHNITVHFVGVYGISPEAHRAAARDINAALAAGKYRTHVTQRFPLAGIAAAHEAQERGQVVGKIVVRID